MYVSHEWGDYTPTAHRQVHMHFGISHMNAQRKYPKLEKKSRVEIDWQRTFTNATPDTGHKTT